MDRELDAMVAEKVMGWSPPRMTSDGHWVRKEAWSDWTRLDDDERVVETISDADFSSRFYWRSPAGLFVKPTDRYDAPPDFKPSSEPAADYEVLKRVRETWTLDRQGAFRDALTEQWTKRTRIHKGAVAYHCMAYEPGDYSRAALASLSDAGKERRG